MTSIDTLRQQAPPRAGGRHVHQPEVVGVPPRGAGWRVHPDTVLAGILVGAAADAVSRNGILTLVPNVVERDVYLCGPPAMADAVRASLLDCGLPAEQLHEERFAF